MLYVAKIMHGYSRSTPSMKYLCNVVKCITYGRVVPGLRCNQMEHQRYKHELDHEPLARLCVQLLQLSHYHKYISAHYVAATDTQQLFMQDQVHQALAYNGYPNHPLPIYSGYVKLCNELYRIVHGSRSANIWLI